MVSRPNQERKTTMKAENITTTGKFHNTDLWNSIKTGIQTRWTSHISVWIDFPNGTHIRVGWSYKGMDLTAVSWFDSNFKEYRRFDLSGKAAISHITAVCNTR
jgi:hypothetical protein